MNRLRIKIARWISYLIVKIPNRAPLRMIRTAPDQLISFDLPNGIRAEIISDFRLEPSGWSKVLKDSGFRPTPNYWFTEFPEDNSVAVIILRDPDDDAVGAFGVLKGTDHSSTNLNLLGVSPLHTGKNLGLVLTTMACNVSREYGATQITLLTDDQRLPAIKTYLKCGFQPLLSAWDRTHSLRWWCIEQVLRASLPRPFQRET